MTGVRDRVEASFSATYLAETARIASEIDARALERMADRLVGVRARGGRLFVLGVGGSSANASHAVNDVRKLTGIEAYAPTDNVSELTARTNDDGWEWVFEGWLKVSRLSQSDAILVLSVGGGDLDRNISPNLVRAVDFAREVGATVLGIVGRREGHTAQVGDEVIVVPIADTTRVTAHAEEFQAVLIHLLTSHPKLLARRLE